MDRRSDVVADDVSSVRVRSAPKAASGSTARLLALMCTVAFVASCGGGSDVPVAGGPPPAPSPSPTPSPTPSPAPAPEPAPAPAPAPEPAPAPATAPTLSTPLALPTGGVTTSQWPAIGSLTATAPVPAIDGWTCPYGTRIEHIHSMLQVFLDGVPQRIPKDIGLVHFPDPTNNCFYGLHTHDNTGIVHIEPGVAGLPKQLGVFFKIWGVPLAADNFGGVTGKPIVIYTKDDGEGALTQFTADPNTLELVNHREITVVIGTAPATVPTYIWPDSLGD